MRYSPADQLVQLILELGASRIGLTVKDVMQRLEVSRRTAERLLSAAERVVPLSHAQLEGDRRKYWRLDRVPPALTGIDADDLAALELAVSSFARQGLEAQSGQLRKLEAKLKAQVERAVSWRVETDLEAIAEAEGFASRPGPRPRIDPVLFDRLRHAIKARRKVQITYVYRGSGLQGYQVVHPYGFLYGVRHYLVAFSEAERALDIRQFALGNLRDVEVLDAAFTPIDGFSLEDYVGEMFGVFREAPVHVRWRFSAEVADDVRAFQFHPRQEIADLPDGRVEVSFNACGHLEMAWHLFTWGPHVEIVEPADLRERLKALCTEALETHGGR
ncbi:MAG: WYL domain-containing protein [Alphaproteobacteria bacterium]|nr:WYL domain-containing protein [Alphaproteobacteria bacterium]